MIYNDIAQHQTLKASKTLQIIWYHSDIELRVHLADKTPGSHRRPRHLDSGNQHLIPAQLRKCEYGL